MEQTVIGTSNPCPACGAPLPCGADGRDLPCRVCATNVSVGAPPPVGGSPAPATTFPIPEGYQVIEKLGEGGMGAVFKANHVALKRLEALKYLTVSDPHFRDRFHREGQILSRLRHSNILSVYGFDAEAQFPMLIIEFVEGEDLTRLLEREGPLRPARALKLIKEVLGGLAYAHNEGVVHRDLKPDNILITAAGTVKLADFGIAACQDAAGGLTKTGMILGTPAYMAPEQSRGLPVDKRADLYSVGVILYRMVAGVLPFYDTNPINILTMHQKQPAPRLLERAPQAGRELSDIVARLMEKDPAGRFQSAEELLASLEDPDVLRSSMESSRTLSRDQVSGARPEGEGTDSAAIPAPTPGRRRTTRRMLVPTVPPPQSFPRYPPPWAFLAAACLAALTGLALWSHSHHTATLATTSSPMRGPTRKVTIDCARTLEAPDILRRTGSSLVVSFHGRSRDVPNAYLLHENTRIPLTPVPGAAELTYTIPVERTIEPFTVHFEGSPSVDPEPREVEHPGLRTFYRNLRGKLLVTTNGAGQARPVTSPVALDWTELLENLSSLSARPVSLTALRKVLREQKTGRQDPRSVLKELADGTRTAFAAVLDTAPILLDRPGESLELKHTVYDVITVLRLLDRLLVTRNLPDRALGADGALGSAFRQGGTFEDIEAGGSIGAEDSRKSLLQVPRSQSHRNDMTSYVELAGMTGKLQFERQRRGTLEFEDSRVQGSRRAVIVLETDTTLKQLASFTSFNFFWFEVNGWCFLIHPGASLTGRALIPPSGPVLVHGMDPRILAPRLVYGIQMEAANRDSAANMTRFDAVRIQAWR